VLWTQVISIWAQESSLEDHMVKALLKHLKSLESL